MTGRWMHRPTKYDTKCHGCGKEIPVGIMVWMRKGERKWEILCESCHSGVEEKDDEAEDLYGGMKADSIIMDEAAEFEPMVLDKLKSLYPDESEKHDDMIDAIKNVFPNGDAVDAFEMDAIKAAEAESALSFEQMMANARWKF